MAHIAIIMTGLTGNLHTSLEMASRLKLEGHQITYLAIRNVKSKIELFGFKYVQLPEMKYDISIEDLGFTNRSWIKKLLYHIFNQKKIYNESKKILKLQEHYNVIASVNPDIAIVDRELHEIIFTLFSIKIPFVISTTWFSNKMGNGLKNPPIRTDIIPGVGTKGSSPFIFLSWTLIKLKVKARIIANKIFFKDYRRQGLLRYAKKNGFPIKEIVASNLPNLFIYPKISTISMTMSEMDFKHKPYKNFKYYGPMVYESRDKTYSKHIKKRLDIIFDRKLKEHKKIIFCSVSTLVPGDVTFLNKLIEATRPEKEWLLIITLGDKIDKTIFENLPENVFLFNWVPQLEVLKNSDININHAGINSINECIHFKVPMLIYSGKNFDQNGCAARVHYHGLGIMGDKDYDSQEQIKHKIDKVLNDEKFKNNMIRFNKLYKNYKSKRISDILPAATYLNSK